MCYSCSGYSKRFSPVSVRQIHTYIIYIYIYIYILCTGVGFRLVECLTCLLEISELFLFRTSNIEHPHRKGGGGGHCLPLALGLYYGILL